MAQMGAPEDETEVARDDEDDAEDGRFAVWRENERALAAFLACRRLWRHAPTGGALGLDRPSVEAELRMRKIKADAALLDDLADIEGGVLEIWSAKQ